MHYLSKIDLMSFGWQYELIIFMLAAVLVVDCVSIIRCACAGREEIKEYAELCVKYLKIFMCIAAGIYFLYAAFCLGHDTATRIIHGVLGGGLILDAGVCLYLKLKYRRKRAKTND